MIDATQYACDVVTVNTRLFMLTVAYPDDASVRIDDVVPCAVMRYIPFPSPAAELSRPTVTRY